MGIHRLPPSPRLPTTPATVGAQAGASTGGASSASSSSDPGGMPACGLLNGLLRIGRPPSARSPASEARAAMRQGDMTRLEQVLVAEPALAVAQDVHGDNLLGAAVRGGHVDAIRVLLDYSGLFPGGEAALVNHRNAKGETALGLAAAGGDVDVVLLLLSASTLDVNATNAKGRTPLHQAVERSNALIVGALLAHEAIRPDLRDAQGDTALHVATARDDALCLELLLDAPGVAVNPANARGQSPLRLAIETGKLEAARALLENWRVDVDALEGPQGTHLLHRMAAEGGFEPALVTLLASHPLLANRPDGHGHTPLDLAIANDQHAALAALLGSDRVETERLDEQLRGPLQQALERIAETSAGHQRDRRIKTLRVLMNARTIDPNEIFANGETLLTQLCARPAGDDPRGGQALASATLAELLKRSDGRLDLNKANAHGRTPLEVAAGTADTADAGNAGNAANTGNADLLRLLLKDAGADPNVLVGWLTASPEQAHRRLHPHGQRLSRAELERFVDSTLAQWADKPDASGRRNRLAHVANAALGARLAARERADLAAGRAPPADCAKGAVFRLSLAVEQCLDTQQYRPLAERAAALLAQAPAGQRAFNLQGVEVSRTEIESWAAGKLPEGGVNRLIDARVAQAGLANAHNIGLTARGHLIMQAIRERLPAERLTEAQCIAAVRAAIQAAPDVDADWRRQAALGLDKALAHTTRVGEGLDTTVGEALTTMWNHIASQAAPASPDESEADAARRRALHGALTRSLLDSMVDMSAGYCDTGCVQRILYCVDGIDLSLLPAEPTAELIRDEIGTLAGRVNNRFEALYGDSEADLKAKGEGVAKACADGTPLSAKERKLIARYQRQRPIDEQLVIQLKQDLLEAAVVGELVERRGWSPAAVRPELDRTKAFMNDL
ncbi:hypothetical protein FHT39_002446 [Mitsuaria sp. BK045]|uniref:ankyrin repeat domain-containing protein n=1 Tax=unclassified Roseateles TaxID=2626991 RepID=UPI001615A70A|nr:MULTISPECIES: ankyrin repeat domain-containing protein [unclassified Roseateles]MBB3293807.1 hypothetical protein [Mitsuaria sp. BK041]MBB3363024.1 hypothetical protein [Mitsuaria sp. BK045]